jgi:PPOX class probable F420-dependent enzyme
MPEEEVDAFLNREDPAMLGVLATTNRRGDPRVVPLWFRWDGEVVYVWTTEERYWVRHIARDPRFAFSVQEGVPPFAGVMMQGRAEVTTGGDEWLGEEIRRITRRYIPEPEVDAYIGGWAQLRTIVTLRPERLKAWSRGY